MKYSTSTKIHITYIMKQKVADIPVYMKNQNCVVFMYVPRNKGPQRYTQNSQLPATAPGKGRVGGRTLLDRFTV